MPLMSLPTIVSALGGPEGIASGILRGIGSIFSQRARRRRARMEFEHERVLQRERIEQTGEQERRTVAYQAMVEDYYSQRNRYRQSQGFQNYLQGQRSGALQGSSLPSLQRMVNYNSLNQVANPGDAPPSTSDAVGPVSSAPNSQNNAGSGTSSGSSRGALGFPLLTLWRR